MSKKLSKEERRQRLLDYIKSISEDGNLDSIKNELESATDYDDDSDGWELEVANESDMYSQGLEILDSLETSNGLNDVDETDIDSLEAIVQKNATPVINVVNDTYQVPKGKWKKVLDEPFRKRIDRSFPSIGRIEMPIDSRAYAGTGFVVGDNLFMTNRHVAWLFSQGLGTENLVFDTTQETGIDFRQEIPMQDAPAPVVFDIEDVVMIHPHFDMALLRVNGLDPNVHKPLKLTTTDPENMWGTDVVTVGYPAFDKRNGLDYQYDVFQRIFEVKRMAPGKLKQRFDYKTQRGFTNVVTHTCSTAGGNSGSCVINTITGEVVGLHFAGEYLVRNYAVSMHDLAQDNRVVDAGVIFADDEDLPPRNDFYGSVWKELERETDSEVQKSEGVFSGSAPDVSGYLQHMSYESLTSTSFSWETALSSALASQVVYFEKNKVIEQVEEKWGFDYCKFIKRDNVECFVAAMEGGAAIVSFRGTQGKRDWLTNLNFIGTSRSYGRVHRGFRSAFMAVKELIEEALTASQVTSIVLTGHSLGGAIATIAAAEWVEWFEGQDINLNGIYTFGQPAVGKGRFPSFMREHFSDIFYRFVNDDDIVTKVPPTYWHVGQLYKFDATGNVEEYTESIYSGSGNESMLSEKEMDKLKFELLRDKINGSDAQEEGLPSVKDHSMANYIENVFRYV